MNKTKLLKFISKYHLGGNVESVELISENGELNVAFITDDKTVKGDVKLKEFDFQDCKMPIYTTSDLVKMISVLTDVIDININRVQEKLVNIELSDKNSSVNFMLAESGVIPRVPALKKLPDFEIKLKLTDEFIDRFIKAKNALADEGDFALLFNNGIPKIVIGYSTRNSNRISLEVNAEYKKEIDPIKFSAKYMKEILVSNRETENGILNISSEGLAYVKFDSDNFTSEYYLVRIDSPN